jgi:hypothetical protein
MRPRPIDDPDAAYWAALEAGTLLAVDIDPPAGHPEVAPCPVVLNVDDSTFHVAWVLDEVELAHLARGGTLWVTTYGVLPPHRLEVQPPPRAEEA